ncbi:hypothetical protein LGR54_01425 [Ancylobacter sp. Lp-2]|uniref:bestrophin-like domain n=1 Tax=Ancylobacter sp. Lp-2 TaxID=2881339 RepID=UPI001E648DB1|nr:hypothetical protein [Ancylobacter sp. Lp-2]MCB4767255.1 hypothetical protein [Ancylobacter sp. Lp-2]
MSLAIAIAERSIALFGVILFLSQLAAYETGHWIGRRHRARNLAQPEAVGVIVGGMLGLLAFVLALTLSFANARFSERQAGGLAEANAIGTAWLRAKALGDPRSEAIARLLEDYTRVRAGFIGVERDQAAVDALNLRTSALQSEMWGHLSAIVRARPDPVASALMVALNEAFDAATAERFAFSLRLPTQMFWLLIVLALLSMACLGYQLGLRERPLRLLVALLTFMWTTVILNILDLGSARLGYLRAGTAAYEWTLQGFKGGVQIPPLPEAAP